MSLLSRITSIPLLVIGLATGAAADSNGQMITDITGATGDLGNLREAFAAEVERINDLTTLDGQSGTVTLEDGITFEVNDIEVFCGDNVTLVQFGVSSSSEAINDGVVQLEMGRRCVLIQPSAPTIEEPEVDVIPPSPRRENDPLIVMPA